MIINALPFETTLDKLYMPKEVRAPLGFAPGSNGYVIQGKSMGAGSAMNYIFTPFPPISWQDLWHLEIHLKDSRGLMQRLVDVLDSLSIEVLSAEARLAYDSRWSAIYLQLDCHRYNSEIDFKPSKRPDDPSIHLVGVYARLLSEFILDLRLGSDWRPILFLERNWPYFELGRDLRNAQPPDHKKRDIDEEAKLYEHEAREVAVKEGVGAPVCFECLPEGFLRAINDLVPLPWDVKSQGIWRAYFSANTKYTFLYLDLVRIDQMGFQSFVVYFGGAKWCLSEILKIFRAETMNIFRLQLRQGLLGAPKVIRNALKDQSRLFTLNVSTHIDRPSITVLEIVHMETHMQQQIDQIIGPNRVFVKRLETRGGEHVR